MKMTTVQEIYDLFNDLYPESLRCGWDNDGMMVSADPDSEVHRVLCALDVTDEVIDEAAELSCDLIMSHHPLLFHPLRSVSPDDPVSRRVIRLLRENISVISFHTRYDTVAGGMNDVLAEKLSLTDTVPFGPAGSEIGRIGSLCEKISFSEFLYRVKDALDCTTVTAVRPVSTVQRVAVLGGDGKDFFRTARLAGADVYVTGEMTHDAYLDAHAIGLDVIAVGHAASERIAAAAFADEITSRFPHIEAIPSRSRDVILYL